MTEILTAREIVWLNNRLQENKDSKNEFSDVPLIRMTSDGIVETCTLWDINQILNN